MTKKEAIKTSKFLSLILRHEPGRVGLALGEGGWVEVAALLAAVNAHGVALTREELALIVETSDKQRFAFSEDGRRIRANQGHSVEVDLQYTVQTPPEVLFHGTALRFVESIRAQGLLKMQRHHVHLSADEKTAAQVGMRHGKVVVLRVKAGEMQRAGFEFYRSANGVWLVERVPVEFIEGLPSAECEVRNVD